MEKWSCVSGSFFSAVERKVWRLWENVAMEKELYINGKTEDGVPPVMMKIINGIMFMEKHRQKSKRN